jgi:hypothetical protein
MNPKESKRMKVSGLVMIFGASVALTSCSSVPQKTLATGTSNPSGKGTVAVEADSNQNTSLKVEVKHLAPPERISSTAQTYVVWIKPFDEPRRTQSLGALTVDKSLNGRLEAVTPYRVFDLFVTPEPSATVSQPSGVRMFWTQVNRKAG